MPIGWAIGAAAVAGVAGSVIQAGGAEEAASQQAGAAENAQQISQNEFNTITQQETPYMQAGYGALSSLDYGLGITPQGATGAVAGQTTGGQSVGGLTREGATTPGAGSGMGSLTTPFTTANWQQLSPAYNFQLGQGQQNVVNSDAASQGALSGSALKDITAYNQGMANTSFNNAFNQYQTQQGNIFSRLSSVAQSGQNAAANTGQQGTALAGQAAQSAQNIGTAQAGGTVGAANAISGGISSSIPWLYGGGGGGNTFGSPVAQSTSPEGYITQY
jgi:hypothetical protein